MNYRFGSVDYSQVRKPEWLPDEEALLKYFARHGKSTMYRAALFTVVAAALYKKPAETLLDIGAGDGELASALRNFCSRIKILCCDKYLRKRRLWDGSFVQTDASKLPFSSGCFDVTLLSNVLHHASNPKEVMAEAVRVTRKQILIKDHLSTGMLDSLKLTALDVLGNLRPANPGLSVTGKYLTLRQWQTLFDLPSVESVTMIGNAPFRPSPWSKLFGNRLEIFFDIELKQDQADVPGEEECRSFREEA